MSLITPDITASLEELAAKMLPSVFSLHQTQNLIVKGDMKWDRIDNKIMKEANKINQKQYLSKVKY